MENYDTYDVSAIAGRWTVELVKATGRGLVVAGDTDLPLLSGRGIPYSRGEIEVDDDEVTPGRETYAVRVYNAGRATRDVRCCPAIMAPTGFRRFEFDGTPIFARVEPGTHEIVARVRTTRVDLRGIQPVYWWTDVILVPTTDGLVRVLATRYAGYAEVPDEFPFASSDGGE